MPSDSTTSKRLGRPTGPRVERTCPQCGKVDLVPPYKLRNPYCSKSCSNASRAIPEVERAWALIDSSDPTGCWPWTAAKDKDGYGLFTLHGGKQIAAHRFVYQVMEGCLLPEQHVLHHCDNPPCCRPDHLFHGTEADNTADKVMKRRHAYGESHPSAKLTDSDIPAIRDLARRGMPTWSIAWRFNVDEWTIRNILDGKNWKHVT